jgi:hypothetical protein
MVEKRISPLRAEKEQTTAKTNAEDAKVSPRARRVPCFYLAGFAFVFLLKGLKRGLGFAEFFGEGFAVVEGDGVEAVENYEIEGEGGDCECEQDGDH